MKEPMKLIEKASPQDIRLNGLIDLELGSDSHWMLVLKDENNSPRLIVPPDRVTYGEVIHNLRTVADAVGQLVKPKSNGWTSEIPTVTGWYWCKNDADTHGKFWIAIVHYHAEKETCSWMSAPGKAGLMHKKDFSPRTEWVGPLHYP